MKREKWQILFKLLSCITKAKIVNFTFLFLITTKVYNFLSGFTKFPNRRYQSKFIPRTNLLHCCCFLHFTEISFHIPGIVRIFHIDSVNFNLFSLKPHEKAKA